MAFPFNYFLAAFAGALLTTLFALPLWRQWCLRTKLVDDQYNLYLKLAAERGLSFPSPHQTGKGPG